MVYVVVIDDHFCDDPCVYTSSKAIVFAEKESADLMAATLNHTCVEATVEECEINTQTSNHELYEKNIVNVLDKLAENNQLIDEIGHKIKLDMEPFKRRLAALEDALLTKEECCENPYR